MLERSAFLFIKLVESSFFLFWLVNQPCLFIDYNPHMGALFASFISLTLPLFWKSYYQFEKFMTACCRYACHLGFWEKPERVY